MWRGKWGALGRSGFNGRRAWCPPSPFCPAVFATEHQEGFGFKKRPLEEGERGWLQLMWSVSITIITNHLITDFPTNPN